mmetsp:Transcript_73035/g.142894  ORF Transcript_73035/g.142894 Transcript_73035/m.142894 type:complete len:296 (+) Transcript_73035:548-1435(+)
MVPHHHPAVLLVPAHEVHQVEQRLVHLVFLHGPRRRPRGRVRVQQSRSRGARHDGCRVAPARAVLLGGVGGARLGALPQVVPPQALDVGKEESDPVTPHLVVDAPLGVEPDGRHPLHHVFGTRHAPREHVYGPVRLPRRGAVEGPQGHRVGQGLPEHGAGAHLVLRHEDGRLNAPRRPPAKITRELRVLQVVPRRADHAKGVGLQGELVAVQLQVGEHALVHKTRFRVGLPEPLVRERQNFAPVREVAAVVRDHVLHVNRVLPVRKCDRAVHALQARLEEPRHREVARQKAHAVV